MTYFIDSENIIFVITTILIQDLYASKIFIIKFETTGFLWEFVFSYVI